MSERQDAHLFRYFTALKRQYASDRSAYEEIWRQARAAYHMDDHLDKVYQGRAKIQVPVVDWKVNGIVSRLNRVLFNVFPIGRFEARKTKETIDKNIIDIWNEYIFGYQLGNIDFAANFKAFTREKTILGTSVAKITQEFETEEFSYFDESGDEQVIKDDTYFRPILLESFYSDIAKTDINDSEACVHSTTISIDELNNSNLYKNVDLVTPTGENVSAEQLEYLQFLGLTKTGQELFERNLRKTRKTGFVAIDEYYGRYDLDGKGVTEVLVTIAQGAVVIRAEKTPFRHKRYKRPFIIGRYIPVFNTLYGESKVIKGLSLLQELNASRAQATDAKTRSIAHMWWRDTSAGQINWDGNWVPNGVISGNSATPAVQPILNPYLGHISIQDAILIERDLDKIWSLSPAQQGTATRSQLPETAKGTAALIEQNEMPINDIIETTAAELKMFFEMLYERNLRFKTIDDLRDVIPEKRLEAIGITDNSQMKQLQLDLGAKILGNMEISNDVAIQRGWDSFLNWASNLPPLVKRLDWKSVAEKRLQSFGIRDDAGDIWLAEEIVQKVEQETNQANQQAQQQEDLKSAALYEQKKAIDTEAKIVEMGAEAQIENATNTKVD